MEQRGDCTAEAAPDAIALTAFRVSINSLLVLTISMSAGAAAAAAPYSNFNFGSYHKKKQTYNQKQRACQVRGE